MAYSIDIEYDQVDTLVRKVLIEDYEQMCRNVDELLAKDELRPHEKEDLDYYMRVRDSIRGLSSYYFNHVDQAAIFGEEVG